MSRRTTGSRPFDYGIIDGGSHTRRMRRMGSTRGEDRVLTMMRVGIEKWRLGRRIAWILTRSNLRGGGILDSSWSQIGMTSDL